MLNEAKGARVVNFYPKYASFIYCLFQEFRKVTIAELFLEFFFSVIVFPGLSTNFQLSQRFLVSWNEHEREIVCVSGGQTLDLNPK